MHLHLVVRQALAKEGCHSNTCTPCDIKDLVKEGATVMHLHLVILQALVKEGCYSNACTPCDIANSSKRRVLQ